MSTIKVVRAEVKDWPDIHDLLVNVAQWLKDQGSQQWNSLLRGGRFPPNKGTTSSRAALRRPKHSKYDCWHVHFI